MKRQRGSTLIHLSFSSTFCNHSVLRKHTLEIKPERIYYILCLCEGEGVIKTTSVPWDCSVFFFTKKWEHGQDLTTVHYREPGRNSKFQTGSFTMSQDINKARNPCRKE